MDNIKSKVVDNNLCMGCGICTDTCHKKAIHMSIKNGINVPVVDNQKCNGCGLCLKTCSGWEIDICHRSKTLFNDENIKEDRVIGRYLNCYSGYSLDHSIRFHSASGGIVTSFLNYLIDTKYIDGAVVVRFSNNDPFRTEAFIAKTTKEIISAQSSKYCPVTYAGLATKIVQGGVNI